MERKIPVNLKKRRRLLVIAAIIALVAILIIDSHFRLVQTEFELYYNNLPDNFDGYRIVQLSDLHMTEFGDDNNKLLEAISEQKPDTIVLTGDFINRKSENNQGGQTQS